MSSGFSPRPAANGEGARVPVAGISSGRYLFFKERIHGRLHFVKTPLPELSADLRCREALAKEFELGYQLDHPGIVRYLRYDGVSVFEEYVDGLTLRAMIDQDDERLRSPRFVYHTCRAIFEALAYLHSHDILHLDLKPENVMITRVGSAVKIIDLDCARSAGRDATPGFTPGVEAPEQRAGGELGPYTDIYLAGGIAALLARHAGCSRRWARFVARATAPEPARRFASAAEALAAMPSPRRGWPRLLLGAALLAACGVGALMLAPGRDADAAPEPAVAPEPAPVVADSVVAPAPQAEPRSEEPAAAAQAAPDFDRSVSRIVRGEYERTLLPVAREAAAAGRGIDPALRAAQTEFYARCMDLIADAAGADADMERGAQYVRAYIGASSAVADSTVTLTDEARRLMR